MDKLGLEMEMVVADARTGRSHAVTDYFAAMARRKQAGGYPVQCKRIDNRVVALEWERGVSGLDNGFNHLESALGPVCANDGGLTRLQVWVRDELADVIDALAEEGAILLNASEHPDCPLNPEFYQAVRAPKPIYDYWIRHRGWHHLAGIDAKAQNGPTTSIAVQDAARAVNVMLALSPALIALFANSPFEEGRITGYKENRLTIWARMFQDARHASDRRLTQPPAQPLRDLGDYFSWIYGEDTVMHTIALASGQQYKNARHTARSAEPVSLRRFLEDGGGPMLSCEDDSPLAVTASAAHFEHMQFMPFIDARFRFRFGSMPELAELLAAWRQPGGLEKLLLAHAADGYIEGRMAGAVFADAALIRETGPAMAAAVVMAPSAIQAGLLANLDEAERLVAAWGWERLCGLRDVAVRDALDCSNINALVGEVLAVAEAGLAATERHWLGYAYWMWRNRRTSADRALAWWRGAAGSRASRLEAFANEFRVAHPREWGAPGITAG